MFCILTTNMKFLHSANIVTRLILENLVVYLTLAMSFCTSLGTTILITRESASTVLRVSYLIYQSLTRGDSSTPVPAIMMTRTTLYSSWPGGTFINLLTQRHPRPRYFKWESPPSGLKCLLYLIICMASELSELVLLITGSI